jgi:acid-sensing ion channel, other
MLIGFFRVSNDFRSTRNMELRFQGKGGIAVSTNDYPLKSSTRNGRGLKITIERNRNLKLLEICTSPYFLVHSPIEYPGNFDDNGMIEFDYAYDFEVLIAPEIIKADADLKIVHPMKRGCYFQGEKQLKYFNFYTRRNCESECLVDALYKNVKINCTPYYMVRSDSMDFYDYRNEYLMNVQIFLTTQKRFSFFDDCGCLDPCDSINFSFEIVTYNRAKSNESIEDVNDFTETSIEFKFKDVDPPLRRYTSFTFSEFLAQSGGMMGLFAGISVLSIIELIYLLSMRWMMNVWRWIREKWCRNSGASA